MKYSTWARLRRLHAASSVDDLAQLAGDSAVVDHMRDEASSSISNHYSMACGICILPCTQLITAPVRPPTLETALWAEAAALLRAGPAELVTLDRPCWAFDTVLSAVSFAAVAPFEAALAASEVVEAARRWAMSLADWRMAIRGRRVEAMATKERR